MKTAIHEKKILTQGKSSYQCFIEKATTTFKDCDGGIATDSKYFLSKKLFHFLQRRWEGFQTVNSFPLPNYLDTANSAIIYKT